MHRWIAEGAASSRGRSAEVKVPTSAFAERTRSFGGTNGTPTGALSALLSQVNTHGKLLKDYRAVAW